MALNITLDYVPDNGRFDPIVGLPAIVSGADISGFGADNLASNFQFIRTATEYPSGALHGHFWFRRGEGQLYIFRDPAFPSGTPQPVGIGPRMEILAYGHQATPAYQPSFMSDSIATGMRAFSRLVGAPYSHYAPILDATPLASGSAGSKWQYRWTQMVQFMGQSGMSDQTWAPVVLNGYTQAYCGSGMSFGPGVKCENRYPPGACADFTYTDNTGSNYMRHLGFILEAKADTAGSGVLKYVFRQFSPRFVRNN
jgi:hypothetical protein